MKEELKITDEQARELEAIRGLAGQQASLAMQALNALPEDQRRARAREMTSRSNAALHEGLSRVLEPAQVARFDQVALRAAGPAAFRVARVRDGLKLTADQEAQLVAIDADLREATFDLRDELKADRAATLAKVETLRRKAVEAVEALMTEGQKASWRNLVGAPFELRWDPPAPARD